MNTKNNLSKLLVATGAIIAATYLTGCMYTKVDVEVKSKTEVTNNINKDSEHCSKPNRVSVHDPRDREIDRLSEKVHDLENMANRPVETANSCVGKVYEYEGYPTYVESYDEVNGVLILRSNRRGNIVYESAGYNTFLGMSPVLLNLNLGGFNGYYGGYGYNQRMPRFHGSRRAMIFR